MKRLHQSLLLIAVVLLVALCVYFGARTRDREFHARFDRKIRALLSEFEARGIDTTQARRDCLAREVNTVACQIDLESLATQVKE